MTGKRLRDETSRSRFFELPVDADITLRLVTQDDAQAVHRLVMDNLEYLRPWVGWANESFTARANREFIQRNLDAYDAGTAYALGIYHHGKLAGVVDIRNLDGREDPEVGYWLAEGFQGKGLATRSVRALIEYARQRHGISHVVLHTMVGNQASSQVAERLGFKLVGEVDADGVREKRYELGL